MDFDLSEDQRLLKESVDRLIADQYQFEHRKKYAQNPGKPNCRRQESGYRSGRKGRADV